jgi:hypothetical protein
MVTEDRNELCYILSPSYSGSTLLTFLLNTHPKIATIGELKARTYKTKGVPEFCSCGETMRTCPFWKRVASELGQQHHSLNPTNFGTHFESKSNLIAHRLLRARIRGPLFESLRALMLRTLPRASSELSRVLEKNRLLVRSILRLQDGEIFLESSKDPIRLQWMLRSRQWNIKVLHLVRDGRGTARSFMNRAGIDMKSATLRFRRPHEQMEFLTRNLTDDQYFRVYYEDLACQPTQVLKDISAFLGLEAGPSSLDFRAVEHHVLGNPMRLKASSDIVLDETWRHALTARELRTFERFGGAINRRLGYLD